LVNNNFGRFLGFTRLGTRNMPGFYWYTLLWYALPSLPLASYAVWSAWRDRSAPTALHPLQLPALLAAVIGSVLALASDSRDLYLMPLMLPLSLLAAQGLHQMPTSATHALSSSARWVLGELAALLLWLGWLALVTGIPGALQTMMLAYQPGYKPEVHWLPLALALVATVVAATTLIQRARFAGAALAQWAMAATLCWALIATLWTPYLNAGKSYRTMIQSLVHELPSTGCLASLRLGEGQRALLAYYAQTTTARIEVEPDAVCPALLVQGMRSTGAPPLSDEWTLVWEGARPGDPKELYQLYRRDVAADRVIEHFPN
jgi:hypothetical protein